MNETREVKQAELKNYLECTVVSLDEDWNITIKEQKIV